MRMENVAAALIGAAIMLGGIVAVENAKIVSTAEAGMFSGSSDSEDFLPVRMKVVSGRDSDGEFFRVWEDTEKPGVTCYKPNSGGIDCVALPPNGK